jgi:O-antigen/teichoic acid export membrane protein
VTDQPETLAAEAPAIGAAAPMGQQPPPRGTFSGRVASIFATRVVQFGLAMTTSIVLARLFVDPGTRGAFVAITTLPGTLTILGAFALPNAVGYLSGKGHSVASLTRAAFILTAVLSAVVVAVVWIALPSLERSFLNAAAGYDTLLRVILLTLPMSILVSFGGTILIGRQDVRVYNFIQIGQTAASLLSAIVLVGVFRLGVPGAVAGSVAVTTCTMAAVLLTLRRLGRRDATGAGVHHASLISYGLRLYPATLSGLGNARADTYILQALLVNSYSKEALGLYTMAVTMAELVFYLPDSISTLFMPRVAGSTAQEANRMLGRFARFSTLITVGVALALIPVAFAGIHLILPRYIDCLPAFLALLPATMSLSLGKVMTSYVAGRGRAGLVSVANVVALVVNVVLNLILIPRFGIVGASLASLGSYTALTAITLVIASKLSGASPLSLVVPGRAEVQLLMSGLVRLSRRLPLLRRV